MEGNKPTVKGLLHVLSQRNPPRCQCGICTAFLARRKTLNTQHFNEERKRMPIKAPSQSSW